MPNSLAWFNAVEPVTFFRKALFRKATFGKATFRKATFRKAM
jgi:hypothetical protein